MNKTINQKKFIITQLYSLKPYIYYFLSLKLIYRILLPNNVNA